MRLRLHPSIALATAALAMLCAAFPAPAGAGLNMPAELDALAVKGFREMYRHEYAQAEQDFQAMTLLRPDYPGGYVFLASFYWWEYSQDFEKSNQDLEDRFFKAAHAGIEAAKAWEKSGGDSVETDLWLGGAYGIMGRWHVSQFEFIRAYLNGNKGYKLLKSVVRRDPEMWEAYLGVGEFEYLASRLPGIVRIPALLFIRGNREGGLKACELAAERARYGSTEAKLFLTAVYSEQEHDYDAALRSSEAAVAEDPDNQFFRMIHAVVLLNKKDYDPAMRELQAAVSILEAKPDHPMRDALPMGYYQMGTIELMQRRYLEAESWYDKAIAMKEFAQKGWVTNCYLRRGESYDLMGRRAEAFRDYEKVLSRRNFWDSHKLARQGLDQPVTFADVLNQFYGAGPKSLSKSAGETRGDPAEAPPPNP